MDSKDGRDLKLKKLGQLFQVLMVRLQKLLNKLSLFVPGPDEIFLIYFSSLSRECLCTSCPLLLEPLFFYTILCPLYKNIQTSWN